MPSYHFPPNFLWGAATSSYQVEGNNERNDWALAAWQGKVPVCGRAVDFYNRFEEDFKTAQSLRHTAHRLSLEWSRIQPEAGRFDAEPVQQYKRMFLSLREKKIKTVVTLHHFTNPLWFYERGGWFNPESVDSFAAYVKAMTEEYAPLVDYWITINEPMVYVYNGYVKGVWPPFEKSLKKAVVVLTHLTQAHLEAYRIIHEARADTKVSFAKHVRVFNPCPSYNLGQNNLIAYLRNKIFNHRLLEYCRKKEALDFIALNYYTMDFVKWSLSRTAGIECTHSHRRLKKNSLGWYNYPEGLYALLMGMKRYRLPVFISENGTSETDDRAYRAYLLSHIQAVGKALDKGVDIIGYLWWSLIDNFEWDKGYHAHFGLFSVDEHLQRIPKPFAYLYRDVCARNGF